MFLPLKSPGPPIKPQAKLETIFPYKLVIIITSNWLGLVGYNNNHIMLSNTEVLRLQLLLLGYQLHTTVINNHIVGFNIWVLFCYFLACLQEKTIS